MVELAENHPKEVVKHRVIRTYSSDHPRPHEALVTALNGGWKIVMCHPIGNELEYILEKTKTRSNYGLNQDGR